MSDNKATPSGADWGLPGFDFTKLIESCQISGVDMMSLIDMEKKNIDALTEVNRSAYESWRNLMVRQTEVFHETMRSIAAEASNKAVEGRRTEIARQGFEQALANMRQLAETATESQKQTIEVLRRRFEEEWPRCAPVADVPEGGRPRKSVEGHVASRTKGNIGEYDGSESERSRS